MTNGFSKSLKDIGFPEDEVKTIIRVRRSVNIKLSDAIIASIAVSGGLVLVTGNREDFERVPGRTIANPFAS